MYTLSACIAIAAVVQLSATCHWSDPHCSVDTHFIWSLHVRTCLSVICVLVIWSLTMLWLVPSLRVLRSQRSVYSWFNVEPDWPVHQDFFNHPPPRLKSRKPIWSHMTPVDVASKWKEDWQSNSVTSKNLISDPTIIVRENVCNNSKKNVKSHVFWILKKKTLKKRKKNVHIVSQAT